MCARSFPASDSEEKNRHSFLTSLQGDIHFGQTCPPRFAYVFGRADPKPPAKTERRRNSPTAEPETGSSRWGRLVCFLGGKGEQKRQSNAGADREASLTEDV